MESRDAVASRAHNNEAFQAMMDGRLAQARAGFEAAIDLDPENATALGNLGYLLTELGALEEARAVLERASALDGATGHVHTNLGNVLFKVGLVDEAIAKYREALREDRT